MRQRPRCGSRCRPTSAPGSSTRSARLLAERHEEAAQTISAESGKPLKAARVEAQRAVSTFTFAAVEARRLAGEIVPMDALAGRRGEARVHAATADRDRRRDLAVQLPAQPRRPQDRARTRCRLRGRAEAGVGDTALGVASSPALEEEAGLPPGWINVVAGSASAIGDVLVDDDRVKLITFTGSGDVGWGIAGRAPRKRVKLELGNATPAIVCGDAPAGHGREARRERVLVRRARAASPCSASS